MPMESASDPKVLARWKEEGERMEALYNSPGLIEWHCPGRHGVIRRSQYVRFGEGQGVSEGEARDMISYYFAATEGAGTWTDPKGNIEFTHQAKVFPPPLAPWEWCGTSVLFRRHRGRRPNY